MGVVYHSNYFIWMEIGRTELFRKVNISYKEIEKKGILLPVVEASCKYKTSAKYDDIIIIKVKIKKLSAVKAVIAYEMFRKKDQVLIAKGETIHGIINKTDNKPVRLNKIPWLKDKLNGLIE
jgi:acyl-CoA thioester hydrolase